MEIKKITVVGLGYIGLPTSIILAQAGYKVSGFDVSKEKVAVLNGGTVPINEPGLQDEYDMAVKKGNITFTTEIQPADAFYICVPTPLNKDGDEPRMESRFVKSAAELVAKVIKAGNLVILESSVAPRTTFELESIIAEKSGIAKGEFYIAHCPERVIPGSMLRELHENDRLIGTETVEAANMARSIYERILTKGTVRVTNMITAEMSKLVENTYRDVNIAFANELSIICDKLGIDVDELISLANCHPRVNVHTPGIGVGGHCIPVVPWFICEQFPDDADLMRTARRINEHKTEWTADKIELAVKCDKSRRLCVLGLTYKQDTDDLRDSTSVILANMLRERGYEVRACEPNAPIGNVMGFENIALDDALASDDFLIITLKHAEFASNKDRILDKPHYSGVKL